MELSRSRASNIYRRLNREGRKKKGGWSIHRGARGTGIQSRLAEVKGVGGNKKKKKRTHKASNSRKGVTHGGDPGFHNIEGTIAVGDGEERAGKKNVGKKKNFSRGVSRQSGFLLSGEISGGRMPDEKTRPERCSEHSSRTGPPPSA